MKNREATTTAEISQKINMAFDDSELSAFSWRYFLNPRSMEARDQQNGPNSGNTIVITGKGKLIVGKEVTQEGESNVIIVNDTGLIEVGENLIQRGVSNKIEIHDEGRFEVRKVINEKSRAGTKKEADDTQEHTSQAAPAPSKPGKEGSY